MRILREPQTMKSIGYTVAPNGLGGRHRSTLSITKQEAGITTPSNKLCSRICSCQSLRERPEATENKKPAACCSIQSTCGHLASTDFNKTLAPGSGPD
jgi:hypothetical protein